MGPIRKSRSVNRRYANEVSPSKDGDSATRSNSRKRKLSDMLGPRWNTEEVTRFYEAYRKYGKDWKKVTSTVKNRSAEMVEALYTMNKAYLSLPHGTASSAGLIAMMTDYYSNLGESDSDQESNDGTGSSRKAQKRARGKLQLATSKAPDDRFVSHSQAVESDYGCLSLLKKKRSGGSRPCPVGKRTPRFPVSFSYENVNGEKYVSPTRQGLRLKANANDDEVAHEIAMALAEASQIGGSPKVSRTPSKKAESYISSPFRHAQRKNSLAEMANTKILAADMDEEDLEGSTEADTGELCRYKPSMMESTSGAVREKAGKFEGKNFEVDNNRDDHLDDSKEECSGTEGQRFGPTSGKLDMDITDSKISRSSKQSHKRKSKKALSERDETPTFDALQTLANMSLMMIPTQNEDESRVQLKDEDDDHVDESRSLEALPVHQQKGKRKYSGVRMKGHKGTSSSDAGFGKTSKSGKGSVLDVAQEYQNPRQSTAKTTRKRQKMQLSKIPKTEVHADIRLGESPEFEGGDSEKLTVRSRKLSQSGSPNKVKNSENSSSADQRKEASDSAQSATQVPVVNQVDLATKVRSKRKMNLKKPQMQNDSGLHDKVSNDQSNHPFVSLQKGKLSGCLLNPRLRRWCTYEWFYSAIDYPWFAKKEFVEYLNHVGLGHVPTLTRVEWGVIRSSLGKPRRFSGQFLQEEKEKLNQYRYSVRKHYTELREGVREGLPTDLARPLSVGQRVIAIHPKTREIHDGSVLTVDHSRCRVQFDRPELGVEFVKDIDCMPLNPFENMPASLARQTIGSNMFFENFNELKLNGRPQETMKLYPGDDVDNADGIQQLSPFNPANLLKQTKVDPANANAQMRIGSSEAVGYQQTASQPNTLTQIQAKEADIQALAELTRALDKKEAVVMELRQLNEDVLENQKDGDSALKESESFQKQYAAVLIQLNEANEQVSSALYCLRQRNTYQGNAPLAWPGAGAKRADPGEESGSVDRSAPQTRESGSHVNEIIDSSRTTARAMVDAAVQAMSSLKGREHSIETTEAIDYVNERLPSVDSSMPVASDRKPSNESDIETQIPSELISGCVATLLMIQKCTERQSPPSDVAQILDSAVTSLQPCSSQNLPLYTEIRKCMGIIRNQIMALIPT